MDVSDLSPPELKALLTLYLLMERALFSWCGTHRAENIYCVPHYKCRNSMNTLALLSYEALPERVLNSWFGVNRSPKTDLERAINLAAEATDKYAALNLRPIKSQGSIEFRHAECTKDINRVRQWIQILMCIKREAIGKTDVDILNIVPSLDARVIKEQLFSGHLTVSDDDVSNSVIMGMYDAKSIVHGLLIDEAVRAIEDQAETCSHPGFLRLCKAAEEGLDERRKEELKKIRGQMARKQKSKGISDMSLSELANRVVIPRVRRDNTINLTIESFGSDSTANVTATDTITPFNTEITDD
jgi:hypothetical protein